MPLLPPVQIGIDENGLGPRLGPMIVTAVRLEIDAARIKDPGALRAAATAAGIGDSKAEGAHGTMGTIERRVLALFAHHLGLTPSSLTELFSSLGHETEASLRHDCPPGEASTACFGDPITLPAFGGAPSREDHASALVLAEAGVRLRAARVGVVCARRMNEGRAAGRSRFDLDLELMIQLASALRSSAEALPLVVLCGKVGGRKSYAAALEPLSTMVSVLAESRARSSYHVARFGEVHFVMDGDASEPAIALASMIGKYVRELWMERINRYWVAAAPDAKPASGYHDPVTARFVEATALARRARAVPDACFER